MTFKLARCLSTIVKLGFRLGRSKDGIAAVEFGLIVPIMMILFIGVIEVSQAITVDRRVAQVASSTGDLVSRQKTLTTATLNGYMDIITQLMAPYSETPLKLTIANVYATTAAPDTYLVCWHYHRGNNAANAATAGLTNGGSYTPGIPTGLVAGGTSVVAVTVSYNYTPIILFNAAWSFLDSGITLTDTHYVKPRLSSSIQYEAIAACV